MQSCALGALLLTCACSERSGVEKNARDATSTAVTSDGVLGDDDASLAMGGSMRSADVGRGDVARDAARSDSTDATQAAQDASVAHDASASSDASTETAAVRGATLPYLEYEAEHATTTGSVLPPTRTFGEIAAEASGRSAVRLDATGQSLSFVSEHESNAIVVRYAIPDAAAGGGIDTTLSLYVDGTRRQSLRLTSRYSWIYGGDTNSENNTPGPGAHHYFDEVHALIGQVPRGATIKLQRDAEDSAPYYVIDLIDLEQVAAPLDKPEDALSISEFGAIADDSNDDSAAIQRAMDAGKTQNKPVFIPRGAFTLRSGPLKVSGVRLSGAGMWYAQLEGPAAQIKVSGNDNAFRDFAIFGEVQARRDSVPENAFDGPFGAGSRVDNVWMEHHKVGMWIGKGDYAGVPSSALTDGLVVRGVRIRNTYADGINLCNGSKNSVVEQSHLRGTGDDALASWSPANDGPAGANNVLRFNTVQAPWRANCFALYGGSDMRIEDNVCADTLLYPGILISTTFSPHPFGGTTRIERNTLTRAGGPMYAPQQHGAFKIFADTLDIQGVAVRDLRIESPTFSGVQVQGPRQVRELTLEGVTIDAPGTVGLLVNADGNGSADASNVVVTGAPAGRGLQNDAAQTFTFRKVSGNSGW
jgi:hypothetical protein